MPDYEYKGSYPAAFPLEIGSDAEVTPAEGNPSIGPTGSTVYLYPLDVLHTKVPIEHAWLEEIAPATPVKATKPVDDPTLPPATDAPAEDEKAADAGTDGAAATPEASATAQPAPPAPDVQPK